MSITIFNVNIVFSSLKDKPYANLVALNQAAMASRSLTDEALHHSRSALLTGP